MKLETDNEMARDYREYDKKQEEIEVKYAFCNFGLLVLFVVVAIYVSENFNFVEFVIKILEVF